MEAETSVHTFLPTSETPALYHLGTERNMWDGKTKTLEYSLLFSFYMTEPRCNQHVRYPSQQPKMASAKWSRWSPHLAQAPPSGLAMTVAWLVDSSKVALGVRTHSLELQN